ncbi:MAG: GGDEF domain-containing protein [Candidatus Omnitrophota bacterium]|nr:GGDEF domain-containing protein [Candidatus Omnitrophota bacterium]
MANSTRAQQVAKLIKQQASGGGDDVRSMFIEETETLAVSRFRLCLCILAALLPVLIAVDYYVGEASLAPYFFAPRLGAIAIVLLLLILTFLAPFRKNSYAFAFVLGLVLGAQTLLTQYRGDTSLMDPFALYVVFFALVGFVMPWGGAATAGICLPIYFFYPLTALMSMQELSATFILKSNLYLLLFVLISVLVAALHNGIRYMEFELRQRMEAENARLHDYQVRLKRAYERVENLAIVDQLTGAYNRTFLTQWLTSEVYKNRDTKGLFSIMMFDIDDFKKLNDKGGHQVGDRVLQTVTQRIHDEVYDKHLVFRYGGDEFCIIFPGIDLIESVHTAERIRSYLENHPDLTIRLSGSEVVHVTISAGVTMQVLTGTLDHDYLIRWVDHAMLESKKAGRNCVHVFDPDERKIVPAGKWLKDLDSKKTS